MWNASSVNVAVASSSAVTYYLKVDAVATVWNHICFFSTKTGNELIIKVLQLLRNG